MKQRMLISMMLLATCGLTYGCAASAPSKPMSASFKQRIVKPRVLKRNHFRSDRTANLTEAQLRKILEAPVFLEEDTRLGIVPVATAYSVDKGLPLAEVPHVLSKRLEDTGLFEVTTEVSTDWPKQRSIAGLRELAARYRVKYLLLYRHRFVKREWTNAWAWSYLTGVGLFFAPANTVETAGVLEATMFDVRTGTILFTAYERVHGKTTMNIWNNDKKRRKLQEQLLDKAAGRLATKVTGKVQRLAAARPTKPTQDPNQPPVQTPKTTSASSNSGMVYPDAAMKTVK